MMRLFHSVALLFFSASLAAQTVSRMERLSPGQKAAATQVKLTGKLSVKGNSDFRQLRDLCWQLRRLDLSGADCEVIPNNALHSRRLLEQVLLPENVKSIGTQAFYGCRSLRSLVLPKSLKRVEDGAFLGCEGIEELVIEGTPALGEFAFARLKNLSVLRLSSKVPPVACASTFEGIDRKRVRLIVPKGAEMRYRKAEGWNRFFGTPEQPNKLCDPSQALVPMPAHMQVSEGKPLSLLKQWEIRAAKGLDNEREQAERIFRERLPEPKNPRLAGKAVLQLGLDASLSGDEAYTLRVSANGITINGRTPAGVFYGLMTLGQLLRGNGTSACCEALPPLYISDFPRTRMRELMVDPCRIFIPFEELKAFVPEMARYKLNALHLHLVDDQAWRIEIKKYPRLTDLSSARVGMDDMQMPIAGFYTQEQMRELVAYAARFHVQVVPEIEMPGHEVAAIHAYPELTCKGEAVPLRTVSGVSNELLCPGKDFTYEFLGNVFGELAGVFPSPYIHLGGDEAGMPPLDCWTDCPHCRALKEKLGVQTADRSENWRLQEYLFDRMIDTLRTRYGKTPMFWYETDFKRIPSGCVTFAWRMGLTREALDAAVANDARVMLCPGEHCYFDYPMASGDMPEVNWGMPVTSLKQTYALDPSWGMGEDFERNNLFGVAGTLWSECINSPERLYYQAYPRAIALAEVGWSPAAARSWDSFVLRLSPALRDMQRRGLTFSMEY